MLSVRLVVVALVVAACGGGSSSGSTFGTIPRTTPTRTLSTATTLPPEPPKVDEFVIAIDLMPDGWVQIDDMSGPIGLDVLDVGLLDGLDELVVVSAYRSTFARSATSELAALARSGAELVVSLALEMETPDAADAAVSVFADALDPTAVQVQTIANPEGLRIELIGGIFVVVWDTDQFVQVVIANGTPGSNLANI